MLYYSLSQEALQRNSGSDRTSSGLKGKVEMLSRETEQSRN